MMPLLVVMGDVVGIYGGYFVAVQLLGANPVAYVDNSFQFLHVSDDVVSGIIKAAVFGLIFRSSPAFAATTRRGARKAWAARRPAPSWSGSLTVLVVDFFLTKLLY